MLKPCPFCGSTHLEIDIDIITGDYFIQCQNCWANIKSNTKEFAINFWNQTVIPSTIRELVDALFHKYASDCREDALNDLKTMGF